MKIEWLRSFTDTSHLWCFRCLIDKESYFLLSIPRCRSDSLSNAWWRIYFLERFFFKWRCVDNRSSSSLQPKQVIPLIPSSSLLFKASTARTREKPRRYLLLLLLSWWFELDYTAAAFSSSKTNMKSMKWSMNEQRSIIFFFIENQGSPRNASGGLSFV